MQRKQHKWPQHCDAIQWEKRWRSWTNIILDSNLVTNKRSFLLFNPINSKEQKEKIQKKITFSHTRKKNQCNNFWKTSVSVVYYANLRWRWCFGLKSNQNQHCALRLEEIQSESEWKLSESKPPNFENRSLVNNRFLPFLSL